MSDSQNQPLIITRDAGVVLVRMNRPEVLNALSSTVMRDLAEALKPLDRDPEVGCIVLTGSCHGIDVDLPVLICFMNGFCQRFVI